MYCNFLYQLSHYEYIRGNTTIADKVYSLNKMLHGVDLFYEISLPKHWSCEHPVGTVMGRAKYGDYFSFIKAVQSEDRGIGKNYIILQSVKG